MLIHLRYANPDCSTKDWIGEASDRGVNISWGRTGRVQQGLFLSPDRCRHNPQHELQNRADKKINKGYRPIPTLTMEGNPDPPLPEPPTTSAPSRAASSLRQWTKDANSSWF